MTSPQRIGIMGGTFDPIHNGHLVAASEAAHRFALDSVIFVPTGQPWQKSHREVTAAEHRYLMTMVATASNPRFTVSRVDIDREGPTYTIDTLRDLRELFPEAEFYFITGADSLASIMSWHNWEEMLEMAHFVGVTRPGYELAPICCPPMRRRISILLTFPRWLSLLPLAANAPLKASPCGTSFRMGWCSTSPRIISTGPTQISLCRNFRGLPKILGTGLLNVQE